MESMRSSMFSVNGEDLKTNDIPHLAYPSTRDAPLFIDLAPSVTEASDYVFHDKEGAIRPGGAVRVFSFENGGLLVTGFMSSFVYQVLRDCLWYSLKFHNESNTFALAASRFVESTAVLAFFVGLLSDCVPLFGYNRKSYLLVGWTIACIVLLIMVLATQLTSTFLSPYTYTCLAACCSTGTMIAYVASEIRLVELSQREPLLTRGFLVAIYTIFRISGQVMGRVLSRLTLANDKSSVTSVRNGMIVVFVVSLIAPTCVYKYLREPQSTRPQLPWRQGFSYFHQLIRQQVVRAIVGFVCVYSAFSNVRTVEADTAIAVWVGVGARGTFVARVGRDLFAIAAVGVWSTCLVNKTWASVFASGPLFNAIPPLVLGTMVSMNLYRAHWFYFGFNAISGIADGLFRLAYLVPLVEICSFGSEGQTVGLVLSFDKLLSIIIRTASDELFLGAHWSLTPALVEKDTREARNRVQAMTVTGAVLRLLAMFALFFLPRQKHHAQEQRVYGTVNPAGGALVIAVFTICFLGVIALDVSMFIWVILPKTSCLPYHPIMKLKTPPAPSILVIFAFDPMSIMLLRLGQRVAGISGPWATRMVSTATEQEARTQMIRWTKISTAMLLLTGAYTIVQYYAHASEDRGHELYGGEEPHYAYLKIRNKPFPWHYSNCDFLDFRCQELARAAEHALQQHK